MKTRVISLTLALALCLGLAACGGGSLEKQLIGSWYRNGQTTSNRDGGKGPSFTLYSDGTCEIATEYGTGTWAVVNGNQLKLTNFYGETETATIESLENGRLTLDTGVFWNSVK